MKQRDTCTIFKRHGGKDLRPGRYQKRYDWERHEYVHPKPPPQVGVPLDVLLHREQVNAR